jgi:hypothetical protein
VIGMSKIPVSGKQKIPINSSITLRKKMSKCKKCNHDCHCNGDLHADEYGLCVCEDCQCKREYKKEKDHGTDMSYENEVKYDG